MAANAYLLSFEDRSGYLFARVSGLTDSLDTSVAFWQEILTEAHERRSKRLLVAENFRNNVSTAAMQFVCRFIADQVHQLAMPTLCIAFVDERPEQLVSNSVGQEFALELGLCARVFGAIGDAEAWLLTQ